MHLLASTCGATLRLKSHIASHNCQKLPPSNLNIYILAGVARGERTKEIARRLGVSERTAWAYLTSIYNKLGVDSRASAVAVAMERGLLLPQQ